MRFFLSVKRTALLGIFISTFMFTGYAHSEQPPSYGNNQRTLKVDKRLLDTNYNNDPVLGHISDYTPKQLREILLDDKVPKFISDKKICEIIKNKYTPQQIREIFSIDSFAIDKRLVDKRLLDTNYYNAPIVGGHITDLDICEQVEIFSKKKKLLAKARQNGSLKIDPYKNTEVLGHISDFTPEQLREFSLRNKELLAKARQNVPIANNNNVSSSFSFDDKTPRKLAIDDFVFPIALLIFISIMSIPISLLWRFGLKVPASLFIITTAGISCSMLLLLAFG